MAGEGTKRIIDLSEAAETQSGDYIAIDSTGRGTRKLPAGFMATAEDLSEEQTARQTADETLDGKITTETENRIAAENALKAQLEVTGTASGAIATFSDGSTMPAKSVIVNIEPQQSGTGTPSPDNERPISGWESVSVTDAGVNVWGGLKMAQDMYNATNNESACHFGSDDYGNYITLSASAPMHETPMSTGVKFKENTQYTIILKGKKSTANASANLVFRYTDGTQNFINFPSATADVMQVLVATSASGKTVKFIEGVWASGTLYAYYEECGLFEGILTADQFKPYTGTTTTVNLGRTVYGGEAEIVGGSLTDKMGVIDLGDINWRQVGSTSVFYASPAYSSVVGTIKCDSTSRDFVANAICSQYAVVSRNAMDSSNNCVAINKSDTTYISVKDSRYTDATAFKTAMSGVKFCYELATPQTYTLTPTEVSTLLGENNIWADAGDISVTYVRDLNIAINNLIGE